MYPNPQDVLPLPPQPNVEQYRKRAKDLVRACRSAEPDAIHRWTARWVDDLNALRSEAERPGHVRLQRHVDQITEFARDQLTKSDCALASAQFVMARAHGFLSWPRFVQHLEALAGRDSEVSDFEQAADAIVRGDVAKLRVLLHANPQLARTRSDREHRATLLHYVAANGVENYRQRTPQNIVAIASVLLDAGADVNAEANVYGGGATTLLLVVTSAHPRKAGVQNELADLLLARGARLQPGIVRDCLNNGCPEAAQHMVSRGATLDLQEASGIGRLDVVERYFENGSTSPSDINVIDALMMAAWYNQRDVITYLLDQGVDPGVHALSKGNGQTALHIAAYQGYVDLTDLLLQRGAPVNVTDHTYHTPPLVWALHAWLVDERGDPADYRAVVRRLLSAGAKVKAEWIEDDRLRADAELFSLLAGRAEA